MTALKLNEITIENIGDWPLRIRVIILFLLAFGLLLCGFNIFIGDNYRQWQIINKDYLLLKNEWINKKQKLKNSHSNIHGRKKINEIGSDLTQKLGEPIPVIDVLQDLQRLAQVNQLDFKNVKQLSIRKQNDLTILPLQIVVTGDSTAIKNFLHEMAKLKRIISVDQFSWVSSDVASTKTELMLIINLYAHALPFNAVNPVIKNEQTMIQPSVVDESKNDIPSLTKVSLDRIILSGIIQQDGKYWALLMTPDNKLHSAIVGKKIGLNGGSINKINAKQMEVVEKLSGGRQEKKFVFVLKNSLKEY